MSRRAALVVTLAAVGCVTSDGNVLTSGTPLTECSQARARTSDQQACAFTDVCSIPDDTDPGCCQQIVTCASGTLHLERYCSPGCQQCVDDTACPPGMTICDGNQCVACPDPAMCPPCAPGTAPLIRNGCPTCTCAPASECDAADPAACAQPNPEVCYPGQVCAPGCDATDPTCCANVCAAPGCPVPAPQGCDTACPPGLGCATCVTTGCACVMGQWSCGAVCGEPTRQCFQPST
ncbi:MAG: hypothetical protein R3B06_27280 [Kofleriaceae bacterium]